MTVDRLFALLLLALPFLALLLVGLVWAGRNRLIDCLRRFAIGGLIAVACMAVISVWVTHT